MAADAIAARATVELSDAKGVLGGIQQRVTSRVDEQKNRAADGLGGIADVIRSAEQRAAQRERDAGVVCRHGRAIRCGASPINIRERGVADMMDDVDAFARRRPALFIGGAFLVGLGIARFLKSSADRGDDRDYGDVQQRRSDDRRHRLAVVLGRPRRNRRLLNGGPWTCHAWIDRSENWSPTCPSRPPI